MYRKLLIGILAAQGLLTLDASVCLSGSLASYEGASACSIGPLNFSFAAMAFQLVSTTGSPTTATAVDITVTPVDISGVNLGFTFGETGPGFSVSAGQEIVYSLTYDVDFPPIIIGGQMDMSDPIGGGASSTITSTLNPFVVAGCATVPSPIILTVASTGAPLVSDTKSFAFRTCAYHDNNTITLNATSGGFADIKSFTQETVIPEPSYTFLIALGGLLAAGRKRVWRY